MADMDGKQFRNALGAFATGVTIVTGRSKEGKPIGMTANSFASVSLDPPLVLWSIDRKSDIFDDFAVADYYAVHVLREDQQDISNHFAKEGTDRFAGIDYEEGAGNLPMLDKFCVRLQCKVEHRYEGGDHLILVGRVLDLNHQPAEPLVFHTGKYKKIS